MVLVPRGWSVPQMSRRRPVSILPQTHFSRSRRLESSLHTIDPLGHFSLGLSSAGVAPLPPCSRKLPDETVKTFAVCEDKCMLSVPSSTSDLHFSCWQSGENCQVVSARAFTLLSHALWFSMKGCSSPCFFLFFRRRAHALSARCFPSGRPDTASFRSCLLLPPGFLDTREAGICAGSRA